MSMYVYTVLLQQRDTSGSMCMDIQYVQVYISLFNSLTASGEKLFPNLAVLVLKLSSTRQQGKQSAGWIRWIIYNASGLAQAACVVKGRETPMIFSAQCAVGPCGR